jgi:hypothetical protein
MTSSLAIFNDAKRKGAAVKPTDLPVDPAAAGRLGGWAAGFNPADALTCNRI